jgi:hypothetical protein
MGREALAGEALLSHASQQIAQGRQIAGKPATPPAQCQMKPQSHALGARQRPVQIVAKQARRVPTGENSGPSAVL